MSMKSLVAREWEELLQLPKQMGEWIAHQIGKPAVDIKENHKKYVVLAEVPGFDKDQVQVQVRGGYLTITAKRSEEQEEKDDYRYLRQERSSTMVRTIPLPEDIEEEGITAEYKHGLLEISIPRTERGEPETIHIKVN